jgi:deoxyhypusine synthase
VILGRIPKNFYLQGQPTLWEGKVHSKVERLLHPDHHRPGGVAGCRDHAVRAVSWGKVNPGVPDTVVAYCDSTIGFPLFCVRHWIGEWPPPA